LAIGITWKVRLNDARPAYGHMINLVAVLAGSFQNFMTNNVLHLSITFYFFFISNNSIDYGINREDPNYNIEDDQSYPRWAQKCCLVFQYKNRKQAA
jgi:hypothetical protein